MQMTTQLTLSMKGSTLFRPLRCFWCLRRFCQPSFLTLAPAVLVPSRLAIQLALALLAPGGVA